jgi:hypothetical protein
VCLLLLLLNTQCYSETIVGVAVGVWGHHCSFRQLFDHMASLPSRFAASIPELDNDTLFEASCRLGAWTAQAACCSLHTVNAYLI